MDKDEKSGLKVDLQKLQNSYFEAAVDNIKMLTDISLEFTRQLLSVASLFLIFIATLFFFLEGKLNIVIFFPLRLWLSIAIWASSSSMMLGILTLSASKRHILKSANVYFGKAKEVNRYIKKNGITVVDRHPKELDLSEDDIKSDRKSDIFLTLQTILLISSIIFTVFPVLMVLLKN